MSQMEEFRHTGHWLFRHRSFLPLLTVVFFVIGLRGFAWPRNSHLLETMWEMFCFAISWLGFAIRFYVGGVTPKGTSGRNTSKQKAGVLNTKGMYSMVRHPLYLGNFLIWLGISMVVRSFLFSLLCIAVFLLYYERIIFVEEEFLREKFGETFVEWAGRTPMMLPNFKRWEKPDLPFSLRTALKKEYSAVFVITSSFTVLEIVGDLYYKGKWELEWMWVIIFSFGLLTYLVLRTLKKKDILGVQGR